MTTEPRYAVGAPTGTGAPTHLVEVAARNLVALGRGLAAYSGIDIGDLHRSAEPIVRAVVARATARPPSSEREAVALLEDLCGIYEQVYGGAGFPDRTREAILDAAVWLLAECVAVGLAPARRFGGKPVPGR